MRTHLISSATVLAAALSAAGAMTSAGTPAVAAAHGAPAPPAGQESSCFWVGSYTYAEDRFNIAYLDTSAQYWTSQYTLPEGARLTLKGAYAHARYQALSAYDAASATPNTTLNDNQIQPDRGSYNPFPPGALRVLPRRSWTVRVSAEMEPEDPAQRQPNFLYGGQKGSPDQVLAYRIYMPDKGRDATGGVGLPAPALTLADGTRLTGKAMCDALHVRQQAVVPQIRPLASYLADRDQPGRPATFPSRDPLLWRASYNTADNRTCVYYDVCPPNPVRSPGQYSNKDNAYLSGYANRGFGPVLVLRGKLPITPPTSNRNPFMRPAQLRYWSLCAYETYTTRVEGPQACVNDEQVPTNRHRDYTIVVSLPGDRPANATARCGVAWISWPARGDGAGHTDDTLLLLRHMMPAADFSEAIQNTRSPGDEPSVMGAYLPTGTYTTKQAFEHGGCGH